MNWKRMIYQGKDYGDYYLVSENGDLKNVRTGKIRKLNLIGSKGYYGCCISLGNRKMKKMIRIHKAVAETFIPNPDNKSYVNHKDGNKKNNSVSNLEWVTAKENMFHSVKTGLFHTAYGEKRVNSKLTEEIVKYARKVYKPNDKEYGLRILASKFNVDHTTLLSAIKGETWKCIAD